MPFEQSRETLYVATTTTKTTTTTTGKHTVVKEVVSHAAGRHSHVFWAYGFGGTSNHG